MYKTFIIPDEREKLEESLNEGYLVLAQTVFDKKIFVLTAKNTGIVNASGMKLA